MDAATLEHSPGTAVALFVTYLQPHLLERMNQTEGAYDLLQLSEVQLQIGLGLEDYRCSSGADQLPKIPCVHLQYISCIFPQNATDQKFLAK